MEIFLQKELWESYFVSSIQEANWQTWNRVFGLIDFNDSSTRLGWFLCHKVRESRWFYIHIYIFLYNRFLIDFFAHGPIEYE